MSSSPGSGRRIPTFAEWLALSDAERRNEASRWNAYAGEGHEIVTEVTEDFRVKYGAIPGVDVTGLGIYHGGDWVIGVTHPFVFDRRLLPTSHLGIGVRTLIGGELPTRVSGRPEALRLRVGTASLRAVRRPLRRGDSPAAGPAGHEPGRDAVSPDRHAVRAIP
jgi:hypothetical protein